MINTTSSTTRERLIGDFLRIALYDEYADAGRGFIARLTPSRSASSRSGGSL